MSKRYINKKEKVDSTDPHQLFLVSLFFRQCTGHNLAELFREVYSILWETAWSGMHALSTGILNPVSWHCSLFFPTQCWKSCRCPKKWIICKNKKFTWLEEKGGRGPEVPGWRRCLATCASACGPRQWMAENWVWRSRSLGELSPPSCCSQYQ